MLSPAPDWVSWNKVDRPNLTPTTVGFIFLLKGEAMDKLGIFKGATELVVSIGVGSIVGNAIKLTNKPGAKLPKRIAVGIGGFVLSNMIGDMANKYVDGKIDSTIATVKKALDSSKDKEAGDTTDIDAESLLRELEDDNKKDGDK